jgi:WD40 repeat protein
VAKRRGLMKRIRKLIVVCALGLVIVMAIQLWPRKVRLTAMYQGHKENVHSLDFDPDGIIVASGGRDGVRVWDPNTLRELWRTTNWTPWNPPAIVKFLPPDALMYSDGSRGVVIVETSGWTERHVIGTSAHLIVATASQDGRRIAAYFKKYPTKPDGKVDTDDRSLFKLIVWDRSAQLVPRELPFDSMAEIVCLAFHPTLPQIAAIFDGGSIRWWDVENGNVLGEVLWQNHRVGFYGLERPATAIAFSPSGDRLHTPIAVIDYPSSRVEKLQPSTSSRIHGTTVAVSLDGRQIARGQPDGKGNTLVTLWNTENKSSFEFTAVVDGGIASICFSPDGRFLAVGVAPRTGWDGGLRLFSFPWDQPDSSVKVFQIPHD